MITDVEGVLVGHYTDEHAATGCTVVTLPPGTVGAYVLAGAAPGTRETDLLHPANLVSEVHAFVLAGGSAFGLAAADGVATALERAGTGFAFGGVRVPIVPAAVIFDLRFGDPAVRPGPAEGAAALAAAGREVAEGSVGAGTGATFAGWRGPEGRRKGGVGTSSVRVGGDGVVGAIMVCNAAGDVLDESGRSLSAGDAPPSGLPSPGESTVIGVVATNARLDKAAATHAARMAAAGIARAVRPAFTRSDGDVVFLAATGGADVDASVVGAAAADVVAESIRRGVLRARSLAGVPSVSGA